MKTAVSLAFLPLVAWLAVGCASPESEVQASPVTVESEVAPTPAPVTPAAAPAPAPVRPAASAPPVSVTRDTSPIPPADPIYRIGAGDKIEVSVFGQPELSGIYTVLSDGTLKYPLIGTVRIADLGAKEAGEKLEAALEEKYLVDAQVNVNVKEFLARPVNVLGSVRAPGKYYLKAQTTVTDILTEAGGLTGESGDTIVITRRVNDKKTGSTYTKTFTLNLAELLKGQDPELNVLLADGDTINVPERMLFYVSGEVTRPGSYKLDTGMTLLKAISAAGGLGKFATKRGVEIHRKVAGEEQVLKFNLGRIEDREEPDPVVMAEDVIIVARRFF